MFIGAMRKRKKPLTLSTNISSYQQKCGFHPILLALMANPYKFVEVFNYN